MAHQVETMAYAGEVPWHGLGVAVNNDLTPNQMMKKAGLDWTVEQIDSYATLPNGKKVATTKDKNNNDCETKDGNKSVGIKIPTNKLFEKSGVGKIKKPPINPIIIDKYATFSLMLLSFLKTSLGENFKFIKLVTSFERYCLHEFNFKRISVSSIFS